MVDIGSILDEGGSFVSSAEGGNLNMSFLSTVVEIKVAVLAGPLLTQTSPSACKLRIVHQYSKMSLFLYALAL